MPSNKMISDFSDKPKTDSFYQVIDEYVMSLGKVKKDFARKSATPLTGSFSGCGHTRKPRMVRCTSM